MPLSLSTAQVSATHGAALNTLQVLFACFFDAVVLHSAPSLLGILGALLVVLGVFSVTLLNSVSEPPAWLRSLAPAWMAYAQVPNQDSDLGLFLEDARQGIKLSELYPGVQQIAPPHMHAGAHVAGSSISSTSGLNVHELGTALVHRRHSEAGSVGGQHSSIETTGRHGC